MHKRNPPWNRDELILALDSYLRHQNRLPSTDSAEVRRLSDTLKRLGHLIGAGFENYRSPASVYMKLNNFRALDPQYTAQGKTGLSRGGKGDAAVWRDFASRPKELFAAADAIQKNLTAIHKIEAVPDLRNDDEAEAAEGNLLTRVHKTRERNWKLVEKKKAAVLSEKGCLRCEVCGFDFEAVYGKQGRGFIEAHHLQGTSKNPRRQA